jgi:hypothetical protein
MSDSIQPETTVVVSAQQVSTTLGDEAVILGGDAGLYFGLNQVGARVWELVQQPVRVSEICAALCEEYEVEPARCQQDVLALLSELHTKGLLDVRAAQGSS